MDWVPNFDPIYLEGGREPFAKYLDATVHLPIFTKILYLTIMMTSVEIKRSFATPGHQRVLKLRGDAQQIFVNGEFSGGFSGFWDYTVYVNPYMVVRPEGHYTKHIYVNSERIASKIGNPEDFGAGDPTGQGDAVGRKIKMEEVVEENFNELFGSVPEIEPAAEEQLGMSSGSSEPELNSYWFTSDHLGSSAFVTDGSGVAIQHLEYMAFGEVFVDQRRTGFGTPYKFNAKELDCESGYYYYSARYYDPRMARFLSVDPLAGEMPEWSSYTYTFNNPLRYIDPTGMGPEDLIVTGNKKERKQIFNSLKSLTDDRLHMDSESGMVTIDQTNNGEKKAGTALVRSLIEDSKSTYLQKSYKASGTNRISNARTSFIRSSGSINLYGGNFSSPMEGIQSDAVVGINLSGHKTVNIDGSRGLPGSMGGIVALGHELNHARDLTQGSFSNRSFKLAFDYDTGSLGKFHVREYNTRMFENRIRLEQGQKFRVLPFIFLK